MSTEDCKFRIPLMMYIKLQNTDCSIDCCDTEIDAMIGVETDIYNDPEFPNLYEATCLFYNLVDVVKLNGETIWLDMYGLFHHNYDIIKEWVKEAWKPEYAALLETDDSGEWEYQLIESIGQLISGNVGEKTAERYVKLFKQFKRVPAKPDEMILVPARQVMIEGEVVNGPQSGGVKWTVKEQTLEHWKENLRRLQAMKWGEWLRLSEATRHAKLHDEHDDTVPSIFGNACPYCQKYFTTCCGACPLTERPLSVSCCDEWYKARTALVNGTKKDAIAAFKAMIKRIEEIKEE